MPRITIESVGTFEFDPSKYSELLASPLEYVDEDGDIITVGSSQELVHRCSEVEHGRFEVENLDLWKSCLHHCEHLEQQQSLMQDFERRLANMRTSTADPPEESPEPLHNESNEVFDPFSDFPRRLLQNHREHMRSVPIDQILQSLEEWPFRFQNFIDQYVCQPKQVLRSVTREMQEAVHDLAGAFRQVYEGMDLHTYAERIQAQPIPGDFPHEAVLNGSRSAGGTTDSPAAEGSPSSEENVNRNSPGLSSPLSTAISKCTNDLLELNITNDLAMAHSISIRAHGDIHSALDLLLEEERITSSRY